MQYWRVLCTKILKKPVSLIMLFLIVATFLSFTVSGTVLSISDARIQSNYFNFNKAWVVSMVSDDYTTDSLTAYLTPQQFKDASGTETKQSLSISVKTKPNYCTYSFKTGIFNYENVYTVQVVKIERFWREDFIKDVESQCADFSKTDYKAKYVDLGSGKFTFGDYVYGKVGIVYDTAYCVKINEKIGTIAQPIDKKIIAESDWTVQAGGKISEGKTISNSEAGSGRNTQLGSNVWVQWQGNLGTGEDCPDVSNLIGVHSNAFPSGWRFSSRSNYQTYNDYLTSGIKFNIKSWGDSSSSIQDSKGIQIETTANNIIRNVIAEKKDFTFTVLDSSVTSGKIKIDLGKLIVFPLFRLIIDADYLEINIPVGKPDILSVSPVTFTEGLAGTTNVIIKNSGTNRGGFTTRIINCGSGFSSTTSPIGTTLNANEQATLTFNIIGSTTITQPTITGSCTAEMKESTSGETATKSFSVTMKQMLECTPLSYACGVDEQLRSVVKKCNSAGTKYDITKICPSTQECRLTTSGADCIDKTIPPDEVGKCGSCDDFALSKMLGGVWKEKKCEAKLIALPPQTYTTCFLSFIKILLVPIVLIFATLFGFNFFQDNKYLRIENKGLAFLVGLVLAGILAYITFIFFTLGIIIFVIYIFAVFLIKSIKPF